MQDKPDPANSRLRVLRFPQGSTHWVALLFLVSATVSLAQSHSSSVRGIVQGSGRALKDVHVRLTREGAAQPVAERVTGADGRFQFAGLIWGRYRLDVSAKGWQSTQVNLDLRSDSAAQVSITLSPPDSKQRSATGHVVAEDIWFGSQFGDHSIQQLPSGRDIWSLLEFQEPSTVTNRFDIGGTQTAVPALFSGLGASWTENQYLFNGLDVTDPYVPGLPLINPGIDTLSEFQVLVASKPARFTASGENLALASPEPTSGWHGGVWLFGSGGVLQSNNMDTRLRDLNFPGPERLNSLLDGSAQLGGTLPIAGLKLPFFASVSTQQAAQSLGGFAAPINTGVDRVLLDFTPWTHGSERLDVLYSGQHVFNSAQGAMPTVAPSATTRGNDNYDQFQVLWNQSITPSTVFSASFGVVNAIVSSSFQNGVQGISSVDLSSLALTGPAPLANSGLRTRYEANGTVQSILNGWLGGHVLSAGVDWNRSYMTNRWYAMNNEEQVLVNGAASEVILWNTPTRASQHVQNIAEYIQDAWRLRKWLMLPIGLRIDTSTGQANGVTQGISWTTLEPRLGFAVPLWPPGMVLQGSWSRYGQLLQGRYLDYGNPSALGGQVFSWTDTNGNGVAQPSELGTLLRVFGGPYSAIDPHLARPYTDEISFGLQQTITNRLTAYARFFRRDDHRLIGLDNTGVPFSDYTPVQYPDPGYYGIYGLPGSQLLTVFNENPSALGHDFLVLANQGQRSSYKGFQALVDLRLWKRLGFSLNFTAQETQAQTSPGNSLLQNDTGFVGTLGIDPNTLLMSLGRTYFDRGYLSKTTAYYKAPHGFYLAMIANWFDGAPFGRLLLVNGLNQGPFFIRATPVGHPGGYQTQLNATLDVRLARDFRLPLGSVSAYADVFNLMNWNSNTQESALTGPTFPLRVPLSVQAPRTIRIGTAWRF